MSFKQYHALNGALQTEGLKEKLGMLGVLASLAFATPLISKDSNTLFNQLARHEGVKHTVYKDKKGIPTIGIGFNLTDPGNRRYLTQLGITDANLKAGISDQQIKQLFDHSLRQAKLDAQKFLPNLSSHPVQVQNAIIDMAFNLGYNRLNKFVEFKKSLLKRNYKKASNDMLDSVWAKQVGNRAKYLSGLVRSS